MASKHFPSLAAAAFTAMLLTFFSKRRSRAINGGEANNDAAANGAIAGGNSGAHTSTESDGMGTSSGYEYDVFLSFSGSDTREDFTDFLYTSFKSAGICTFKDDKNLHIGEEFARELLQAIEQSKILIPIFSKNYASSVWCLNEVAQMVECKKTGGQQKIIPIFYDVAPGVVRHQIGGYGKAFRSHESKKRHNKKTIRKWRDALKEVSYLNGKDLQSMPNRREGEFVEKFTEDVLNELRTAFLMVPDCLIGIDDQADNIMAMIGAPTSETRIIGIHGMGGIGKTTVAKVVYNQLSKHFRNCCYLSNIREVSKTPQGIVCLQQQLVSKILERQVTNIRNSEEGTQIIHDRLSNKKVLILLDDVDNPNDMNALAVNHILPFGEGSIRKFSFGEGSILIITTRDKEVLNGHGVQDLYEVNIMDSEHSLQLFRRHAFIGDYPLNENINQSNMAVKIAGGLPQALVAIGSSLVYKGKEEWDGILKKLERSPDEEVMSNLKISYKTLKDWEQHIFCDVACLFNGYDKDILLHFWRSRFCSEWTMDGLENKSLIKIEEDNKLSMHEQLRYLGKEIVREESKMEIKEKKRLWDPEEVLNLLTRTKRNAKVEALKVEALKFDCKKPYCFTYGDFQMLSNLKFLEVDGSSGPITAEEGLYWKRSSVFRPRNSPLLPEMRWLSWHDIPPRFDIASFSIQDVTILDLSRSEIKHDWKGWSHIKVMKNLKVLDLTDCHSLWETPVFRADSSLERLILARCTQLIKIDESICQLKCLVSLDVSYCVCLRTLPDKWDRDRASLEYLSLKHCESLEGLPDSIKNLKSLIKLDISNTRIKELPATLWTMPNLTEIKASTTYGVERFQVNIGDRRSRNNSLKILRLRCAKIYTLPELPQSLVELQLSGLCMNTFPDLSHLTDLKELELRFDSLDSSDGRSNGLEEYRIPRRWIENLTKLESLSLSFRCVNTSPPTDLDLPPLNLGLPPQLKSLALACPNLRRLPILPPQLKSLTLACPNLRRLPILPSSLSSLHLSCGSLCSIWNLSDLKNLSTLQIDGAAITQIEVLGRLQKLRDLRLLGLGEVRTLPDLRNLQKLTIIHVIQCGRLVEIQGELPESLVKLYIRSCNDLREVPGLPSLRRQQKVEIEDCENLS